MSISIELLPYIRNNLYFLAILLLSFTFNTIASEGSIQKVKFRGKGCPAESIFVDLSPDKEILSILFNQYIIEKQGSTMPFGKRKNCNLNIWIKKNRKSTFGIFSTTIEGVADLEKGLIGIERFSYTLNRQNIQKFIKPFIIRGPYADQFSVTRSFNNNKIQWSSCYSNTSKINIKTSIAIRPYTTKRNNASGFMAINALEGGLNNSLNLVWKKCDQRKNKKNWLAFCTGKIFNKNKKFILKETFSRARAIQKEDALDLAYEKSNEKCSKINKSNRKIYCKTEKKECSFLNLSL